MDIKKIQNIVEETNKKMFHIGQNVSFYVGRKTGTLYGIVIGFHKNGSIIIKLPCGKECNEHPLSLKAV